MSATTSFILPQFCWSAILRWMTSTGTPARSPIAIASFSDSKTLVPSLRWWVE
jgi:hypothetical protein